MSNKEGLAESKFMLRLPVELKNELKESAARDRRSMNSEVVLAVEAWLRSKAKAKKGNAPTVPAVEA